MNEIIDKIVIAIKKNASFKFRLGLLLLLINVPIGWILGPLLGVFWGWRFNVEVGAIIALTFYIVSWGMLGTGILLAGKDGYLIFKQIIGDIRNSFLKREKG